MAIPWATIKSLLLFFGPWLLPRAIGYYRTLQAEAARQRQTQQAAPAAESAPRVRRLAWRPAVVLGVLAGAAAAWLATTGAAGLVVPGAAARRGFGPENVFAATQSRLQIPTDVLFTRLAALRAGGQLTAADEALRGRFASLESRLLYLQFGPSVLAGCPFCGGPSADSSGSGSGSGSGRAYFAYALLDVAAVHLGNLVLIALATSPLVLLGTRRGGKTAADDRAYDVAAAHVRRWRAPASVLAIAVAGLDAALLATYDRSANARATRLAELHGFFWSLRRLRGLACGGLLLALAAILYGAATGRSTSADGGVLGLLLYGPPPPPSPAARVTAATRALAAAKSKLSAGAIVKNTALRDAALRARTEEYWAREVRLVAAAMEERDVVEGVQDALQNRIDIQQIERDAETYAQSVLPLLPVQPGDGGGDDKATPVETTE